VGSWTNFIDSIVILERLSSERERIVVNINNKDGSRQASKNIRLFLTQTSRSGAKKG
jgi:hypothetical protein